MTSKEKAIKHFEITAQEFEDYIQPLIDNALQSQAEEIFKELNIAIFVMCIVKDKGLCKEDIKTLTHNYNAVKQKYIKRQE